MSKLRNSNNEGDNRQQQLYIRIVKKFVKTVEVQISVQLNIAAYQRADYGPVTGRSSVGGWKLGGLVNKKICKNPSWYMNTQISKCPFPDYSNPTDAHRPCAPCACALARTSHFSAAKV